MLVPFIRQGFQPEEAEESTYVALYHDPQVNFTEINATTVRLLKLHQDKMVNEFNPWLYLGFALDQLRLLVNCPYRYEANQNLYGANQDCPRQRHIVTARSCF